VIVVWTEQWDIEKLASNLKEALTFEEGTTGNEEFQLNFYNTLVFLITRHLPNGYLNSV